jgi:ubiquitin-protein ligase
VNACERLRWFDDDPARLQRELAAMATAAPHLMWFGAHWAGELPLWPMERPEPAALRSYVGSRRFVVEIHYPESFPMVAPRFVPIEPEPELSVRTLNVWHVLGDGALCMFQSSSDWDPHCTAADLVPKAAGWYLEYLLMQDGRIDSMTQAGIVLNDELDGLFSVHSS